MGSISDVTRCASFQVIRKPPLPACPPACLPACPPAHPPTRRLPADLPARLRTRSCIRTCYNHPALPRARECAAPGGILRLRPHRAASPGPGPGVVQRSGRPKPDKRRGRDRGAVTGGRSVEPPFSQGGPRHAEPSKKTSFAPTDPSGPAKTPSKTYPRHQQFCSIAIAQHRKCKRNRYWETGRCTFPRVHEGFGICSCSFQVSAVFRAPWAT